MVISFLYAGQWPTKENQICKEFPKHKINLSYQQLCEYGKLGCKNIKKTDQIQALCNSDKLSTCFDKKQLMSIHQYMNVPDNMTIKNTGSQMSIINGVFKKELCVELAKANKSIMSNEKFLIYQKMAPEVLDILNNENKKIISCLEKEKSLNNVTLCTNKTGKPLEEMIVKLIPTQVNELCTRDSNKKLHFVWSKENYDILIAALKKTVSKHEKNKKCLLKSKTLEEYATCLKI